MPQGPRAGERQTDVDRIVFWGWILAAGSLLLIAFLGIGSLILGSIAAARGRVGSGVAIITATLIFAAINVVVWAAIVGDDSPSATLEINTETSTPDSLENVPAREAVYQEMGYDSPEECASDLNISIAACQ